MTEPEWTVETLKALFDERFGALAKALELQAEEYERRLEDLNHAHEEARLVASRTVTREAFDQYVATEREKREFALDRVNEKFEDYIKRYEQRQREVDLLLSAQQGASEEAKRSAEEQGRKSRDAIGEQARKQNRNLMIVGLVITVAVAAANYLGAL
jgi:predicted PolB exonuclease-like 3'-5' exonuclease